MHKLDSKYIKTKQKLFKSLKTKVKTMKKTGINITEQKLSKLDSLVVI